MTPSREFRFWVLFLLGLWALKMVVNWNDATGTISNIIIILVSVIAGIRWVFIYLRNRSYRLHPFDIKFEDLVNGGVFGSKIVTDGTTTFFLRVRSKHLIYYEKIRLLITGDENSKAWITQLSSKDYAYSLLVDGFSDSPNSQTILFDPPLKRTPEELLHLVVSIKSRETWSGQLVFQAERVDNHLSQASVDLSVVVVDKEKTT